MAAENQVGIRASRYYIPEPALARFLFGDTRMAWFWLIVRLYVGYQWLAAGWEKLFGFSINYDSFGQAVKGGAWVFNNHTGAAIQGFAKGHSLNPMDHFQTFQAGTHGSCSTLYYPTQLRSPTSSLLEKENHERGSKATFTTSTSNT
jgi:hypothetical protein